MVSNSRRKFLQFSANSTAALAAMTLLPKSLQNALARPVRKGTGSIQDVKHVVIFMQENRSFDHYFGALKGVRGFDDPRAFILPSGKPVWYQPNSNNNYELPFHLDSSTSSAQWLNDLDHSWKGSQKTWERHDCWINKKGSMSLGYFNRNDIPFYYALADAFTIGDAYHASIFGPTDPNRMHLFTGTSGLSVNNNGLHVVHNEDDGNETADMSNDNIFYSGYRWKTYAERLEDAGISWKVYQEYDNYGDNSFAYFHNFRNIDSNSSLYLKGRAWVNGSNASNAGTSLGQYLVDAFGQDIRNNTLPQVSWIVAPTKLCEHPNWPPAYGENLASRLIDELAKNEDVWSSTAFIINYDENDGFFDHMPPHNPAINRNLGLSTVDTSSENYNGEPLGLGIRVPLLVVSPWTKGGWVCSEVFDHTSVIRFLEKCFNVYEPNISPWRRAICGDLTSMFNFKTPDDAWPTNLPDTSNFISNTDFSSSYPYPKVPQTQILPKQEKGIKPFRPLPYVLIVDSLVDEKSNSISINFINMCNVGSGFNVYTHNNNQSPRYYTVEAQKKLTDNWNNNYLNNNKYDLSVHGPCGFYRYFKGDTIKPSSEMYAKPEIYARYLNGDIQLYLCNTGNQECIFTIVDNSYGLESKTINVNAGVNVEIIWNLSSSANWYDLSITVNTSVDFLRKLAGHIETGLPSTSDPQIGRG